MSRPLKMECSKCGANITMAGSQVCNTCTPINADPDTNPNEFDRQLAASERQPLLCGKCFDVEHGHHMQVP